MEANRFTKMVLCLFRTRIECVCFFFFCVKLPLCHTLSTRKKFCQNRLLINAIKNVCYGNLVMVYVLHLSRMLKARNKDTHIHYIGII